MTDFLKQIERIKQKLPEAKKADSNLKVFGADSHKYSINKPANSSEIEAFESEYSINLPECYKSFLLFIGNGGSSYRNSAAGPFYGIYRLGDGVDELIYVNVKKHLNKNCKLSPDMDEETWQFLNAKLEDENISDEDFDTETGSLFAGILPIGSQGCTYIHGLILNGQHKGRVVNLDLDRQMPQFTYEDNFLDWYERWLDEVIDGTLVQDGPSWFGYSIGGDPESLLSKYNQTTNVTERQKYLYAILRKGRIHDKIISEIKVEYEAHPDEIILLEILTKFNYGLAKDYLIKLSEKNFEEVVRIIHYHALIHVKEWIDLIEQKISEVNSHEFYLHIRKMLESTNLNFGSIIIPLLQSDEKDIRSSVINTLGNLKQKHDYINEFKIGLEDAELSVIHHTLGALYECKDKSILPYYKRILDNLPEDMNHSEKLTFDSLNRNLKLFGLTTDHLKNSNATSFQKKTWFRFWQ